jgi:dephospho-CoA kinase
MAAAPPPPRGGQKPRSPSRPGLATAAADSADASLAADDATALEEEEAEGAVIALGLTGSIGMGKSSVSAILSALAVPVLDADAVVHALYAPGGAAVAPVAAEFGDAALDPSTGGVCRQRLSRLLGLANNAAAANTAAEKNSSSNSGGDGDGMRALERIVHPLVAAERRAFLRECARKGEKLAALDVPLLFETGGHDDVDAVAVVSAPLEEQRRRVLARPGMTPEKFEAILSRQVPDEEKRRRAHFVIDTGVAMSETERAVRAMVAALRRGEASMAALAEGGCSSPSALVIVQEWRLEEVRMRRRRRREE